MNSRLLTSNVIKQKELSLINADGTVRLSGGRILLTTGKEVKIDKKKFNEYYYKVAIGFRG